MLNLGQQFYFMSNKYILGTKCYIFYKKKTLEEQALKFNRIYFLYNI